MNGPISRRLSRSVLFLWLVASTAIYIRLAGLRAWSGGADVVDFLLTMGAAFVLYGLACYALLGKRVRIGSGVLLLTALWLRLLMLPVGFVGEGYGVGEGDGEGFGVASAAMAADLRGEVSSETFLLYDNDVWRYLWDGHLTASGVGVYRLSPAEVEQGAEDGVSELEALLEEDGWEEVHSRVSYQAYRTIYPPLAQALFALVGQAAPASVLAWRLLMIGFDLGTCVLIVLMLGRRRLPVAWAVIYAWNPMVIKELAASVHVDAALIFFLLVSVEAFSRHGVPERRPASLAWIWMGWAAWSAALLIKPTPIVILPLLLRRAPIFTWILPPLLGAAAFLPFRQDVATYFESLGVFAEDWAFNAGPWALFHALAESLGQDRALADGLSAGLTLGVLGWIAWRDDGSEARLIQGVILALAVYLVLSPTVMPWYLLWVLPFVCLRPSWTWPVFTAASLASYGIYVDGEEAMWWRVLEYGAVVVALAWDLRIRRRAGP